MSLSCLLLFLFLFFQAGLELVVQIYSCLSSQVLGFQICVITPGFVLLVLFVFYQELTNDSLRAKLVPPTICVNKVLLGLAQ